AVADTTVGLHLEACIFSVPEEDALVTALCQGHENAYEVLIQRYQQPVYNLVCRLLNDPSDACDIVQEVFLKVFRNIGSFRGKSSLKTWIYRITVNEAHNARRWFFRHRRREVELDTDPNETRNWRDTIPDSSRSPFDVAFDREQAILIQAALDRINPVFRSAVVLRDITDLSYEEIADILGISLGTVKSRILRGREALREELIKGNPGVQRQWRLVPKTAE
ncbi:MAG TPA: sigma-70 family RNA polymerase sigma factor, partial [Bryobacteraceae bacterium]|nr:sigma-70 family RNA polymerase sigma factor [Bryobacteraceae bacterium]